MASAAALCCIGISFPALAAPPAAKTGAIAAEDGAHPAHLDLRPPLVAELTLFKTNPNGRRPTLLSLAGAVADDHAAALAAGDSRPALVLGRAQTFIQRFGHEGLPLARLWEGHSAFISLGLSPRGKPGLWLVQKTP